MGPSEIVPGVAVGSMNNWLNALESGHAMAVGQGFVPIPENAPSKVSSPSSQMPAVRLALPYLICIFGML